jgi:hypothetical protein
VRTWRAPAHCGVRNPRACCEFITGEPRCLLLYMPPNLKVWRQWQNFSRTAKMAKLIRWVLLDSKLGKADFSTGENVDNNENCATFLYWNF